MKMSELLSTKLTDLYAEKSADRIRSIEAIISPAFDRIVKTFYAELMDIPEIAPLLVNSLVEKNLQASLKGWLAALFRPHDADGVEDMIKRQRRIGIIHANINVNLNYFNHGISILKREIYRRLLADAEDGATFTEYFLLIGELFDILVSIITESYFSNEMIHENNELSLKVKGLTHNAAIECERLRSMLLDWLRNTLTFLFQSPGVNIHHLPRLQYSNFGLWVIYKADFLSHPLNVSPELKKHIRDIDQALFEAAKCRADADEKAFFDAVNQLNDEVTKASWFISTIVDQALEIDTGMDPLTRLFNRRYLETILRRQTDISIRQGFPFSLLLLDIDHFKRVNDAYGHDSGDSVLKQFSEILLLSVRASDFIFRYGGEEFLIVLGAIDKTEAFNIAEKIRRKCEKHVFRLSDGVRMNLTCSIGVAAHGGHPDYNRLIKLADQALYQAKAAGRNKTVTAD